MARHLNLEEWKYLFVLYEKYKNKDITKKVLLQEMCKMKGVEKEQVVTFYVLVRSINNIT
ncbi:hypothetical protein [Metamycoplasma alkalescens]|uniref:hypothetical protein n=1 Tax=Metamycoplasma alkalescens TaxID=45363 RepID=UPI003D0242D1